LQSQKKLLSTNIETLQKKEANNLEEILFISRQMETIYEKKEKCQQLKFSTKPFENLLEGSVKLILLDAKKRVPRSEHTKIDLERNFNWEKVLSLCKEFDSFEDLVILNWKAEALKSLGMPGWEEICEFILQFQDTENSYEMFAISKAFKLLGDEKNFLVWTNKSSDLGNEYAQTNLGCMTDSTDEEILWFEKSANQGYFRSQYNLAISLNNRGEHQRAMKLLEISASVGYKDAMELLSIMYEDGMGCEVDEAKATYWRDLSK
jgi:hypothetical protein